MTEDRQKSLSEGYEHMAFENGIYKQAVEDWPYIDTSTTRPHPPLRPGRLSRWIGVGLMRLFGFKVVGQIPPCRKFLVVAGPHTSNWDFVFGMFTQLALGLRFSYMIKDSAMVPVVGSIIRALGGIGIDRSTASGVPAKMIKLFAERDDLVLVITPEGTRKNKKRLKSGFYHIASQAGVPVGMVEFDFGRKQIKLGNLLHPSLSYEAMVAEMDKTFGPVKGCKGYWMDRTPEIKGEETSFETKAEDMPR